MELAKVTRSLEEGLTLYKKSSKQSEAVKNAFRDACIQRFKYCIELAWKTSMKILGSSTVAAKPAIREMARSNLMSQPDLWLQFIEARNDSSHSYDDEVATKVFKGIETFYPECVKLIENLSNQK